MCVYLRNGIFREKGTARTEAAGAAKVELVGPEEVGVVGVVGCVRSGDNGMEMEERAKAGAGDTGRKEEYAEGVGYMET